MQTNFSLTQLADPNIAEADKILRACVHCGFCTATRPTYVLLGDELDSPRGRIYLIKEMLEQARPATADVVKHIDRCLSCLACMTTCPSGVHYMHLVDHARAYIEKTFRRPFLDRTMRAMLACVMPYPARFQLALIAALAAKPFAAILEAIGFKRIAAMLRLAPWRPPRGSRFPRSGTIPAEGARKHRVVLMSGCVDQVVKPEIRDATIRLLARHGNEVVLAEGEACCGSLSHHMGREREALSFVKNNVDVWTFEMEKGLDAILITASGCGTTVKDYGFMLRTDPAYAGKAAKVSALAKDISEYLAELDLSLPQRGSLVVAYHSACSMQHGQNIKREPKALLAKAGFVVKDVPEGHLCCGSAGTYNMLQPEIARRLVARKVANIEAVRPQLIATGNIGCMAQIGSATGIPIVHTVELLDWASGGPMPAALAGKGFARSWAEPAKPIGHVMAEGNETSDVWGRTADIDESALSVMAERLESRAKHPFFRRVIAEYIGDLELERISSALEIGCGTGVVSRALAVAPGFRGTITATDVSPHLIDAGRRYAEMEGVEGRIAFEVINAADLHAENSTYDLIIAHTLFSHAANPVAILAECGRVLRSRGQLLIFDRDFASSALSLEKEIVAKIDIGDIARAFAAQPYIIRQLPRLLADTGFAIESHRSYVIADVGRAEFFSEQLTTWRRLLPVSGVISKGDADLLMNGLEAASAAGTLFWANNFYTFMARKTR